MKVWHILALVTLFAAADGVREYGRIFSEDSWVFMGRFCFVENAADARLQFNITVPRTFLSTKLSFYYDEEDQWEAVYDPDTASLTTEECEEKNDRAAESTNILDPTSPLNDCEDIDVEAIGYGVYKELNPEVKWKTCSGTRSFKSARNRWWYFVLSRCRPATVNEDGQLVDVFGINAAFEYTATNGVGFYSRHFSANDMGILEENIAFLVIYTILCVLSVYLRSRLKKKHVYHPTTGLMLYSIWAFWLFLVFSTIHWGKLGADGYGADGVETLGGVLKVVSECLIVLTILLIGKGWGVARGRISTQGRGKIAAFITIYALLYLVMWALQFTVDPAVVRWQFESVPGIVIVAARLAGAAWFTYAVSTTLRNYPDKREFYRIFYAVFIVWWLLLPGIVLFSFLLLRDWDRNRWVHGFELSASLYAHVTVMWIVWPPRRGISKRFPYTVTANQVGIGTAADAPAMTPKPFDPSRADPNDPNRLHLETFESPMVADGAEPRDPFMQQSSTSSEDDGDDGKGKSDVATTRSDHRVFDADGVGD